ncbi:glycerol-3-phosphate acyltransferase [Pseudonocardia thermophila]|uniref:Glycerol-3-phosphate acyltransferase n=1 Tax=Pseudonocardia thermophila TaxID=1848 RepID=A0A1M6U6L9_PSETH|nr:glycerol-3-phosphate 1-O-acyltransferase [Pseudonocardia thermophila]SHK64810.1 glycerol-3-phosphate acyltransferase [Pseudonocardia thermophila]
MHADESPGTTVSAGPAAGGPVVLTDAVSETERALVASWLQDRGMTAAQVLPVDGAVIAGPLGQLPDDTLIVPVRVAWLPRERDGQRRARWSDLLSLTNPWRPAAHAQTRILKREPDRAAVVAGEPATVADLRRTFASRAGGAAIGFGDFVARQAALALERAERALVGRRYKVPKRIVEAVEASPEFRRDVAELAAKLELDEEEVARRASHDLHGLVASMSPLAVDLLSGVLRPLHSRAWNVQVDTAGLERLRELNRRYALVFLPSHRSYVDPLLLADVLAEHDFPRNHVLSGDNLNFWPFGPLAKRAGVVFIRRTFGDDEIYKLAVRQYFGYLLSKRFNLEWYMEGGRSRTGKLRPPRYGLLANVAEAVERGRAEDAYLVPVSITYDQLREVSAMAAEQVGVPKKGEGLTWLASYAKAQLSPIGSAYVRFAEPISLRAALAAGAADPGGEAGRRRALQKVAFEVAVGINRVTPVVATALVTLALLGVRDRALTLGQVRRVLQPVQEYLAERDLMGSAQSLATDRGLRRVLGALTESKVVTTYSGGEEPVYAIERGSHLVAAFYRNSAIHHFVDRAIAECVLLAPPGERFDRALALRDLLKFEFFFPDRDVFRTELGAELERLGAGWGEQDAEAVLGRAGFLIAPRVLRSFLDSQLVVAERLAVRNPRTPVVEKEFLDECGGIGQQMLLQGRLHGPESLSRELFASALKLAANRDLVDPGRDELRERREVFRDEVRAAVAAVVRIAEIDAVRLREVMDGAA